MRAQRTTSAVARTLLAGTLAIGLSAYSGPGTAVGDDTGVTDFALTATVIEDDDGKTRLTEGFQGFSVESADFAHGYLTSERMAQRLRTLGDEGVIRIGGYSMDLVWPAFGDWAGAPAPAEAIGGTVDQQDLDALNALARRLRLAGHPRAPPQGGHRPEQGEEPHP